MSKTVGVVLAGGESSRMGSDKAALCVSEGTHKKPLTLLHLAREQLARLCLDQVYVSGAKHGGFADHLMQKGPVGGLLSSIHAIGLANGDRIVVVPVDMPSIPKSVFEKLIAYADKNLRSAYMQGSLFPFVLAIDCKIVQTLHATLQEGGSLSIVQMLNAFHAVPLASTIAQKKALSININTPSDLKRFAATRNEI